MTPSEPHNPFYLLLLVASVLFVATALGYGVLPVLEEKAAEVGPLTPDSPFRQALRRDGGLWLLYELAAMTVLALLSMGLDRLRTLQKNDPPATIPPTAAPAEALGNSGGNGHVQPGTTDRGPPSTDRSA